MGAVKRLCIKEFIGSALIIPVKPELTEKPAFPFALSNQLIFMQDSLPADEWH